MLWDGNFGNRVFAFRDLNPVCKNWNQKVFLMYMHTCILQNLLPEKFTTHVVFGQYLVSIYGSIVNTCTMHIIMTNSTNTLNLQTHIYSIIPTTHFSPISCILYLQIHKLPVLHPDPRITYSCSPHKTFHLH